MFVKRMDLLALLGLMLAVAPGLSTELTLTDAGLHLVAFRAADSGAVDDLIVTLEGGQQIKGNQDGIVRTRVPTSTTQVCVNRLGASKPTHCLPISFRAGQVSLLIVSLDEQGQLVDHIIENPVESQMNTEPTAQEALIPTGFKVSVLSEASGQPVAGARVFVVGQDAEVVSNADGVAEFTLYPKVYTVTVIHSEYATHIERDVSVSPTGETLLTVKLGPLSLSLDDFVVTVPRISGSVAKLFEDRRKAASVQDGLGSEELARSPDGSASSASRRIVGASIVGGQFLIVRGLGGRYTNVRLNDVPLPSTDPDMPGVQMDLFPSSLLSSLTIEKTFRASLPANFAGGTMNIETKSFPEAFQLKASVATGFDSASTGRRALAHPGSSTDWLGWDDGRRSLPSEVPQRRVTSVGLRGLPQDEVTQIGQSFESNWSTHRSTNLPPLSLGLSVGDTLKRRGWSYGYLVTAGYKYKEQISRQFRQNFNLVSTSEGSRLEPREQLEQETGQKSALLGGLASLSLLGPNQQTFKFVSLITQTNTNDTSVLSGRSEQEDAPIRLTQLQYVERRLWLNQLIGEHPNFNEQWSMKWRLNLSSAARDQPDTRSLLYLQRDADEPFSYRDSTGSGERLFSGLEQVDYGAAIDFDYRPNRFKANDLSLKFGSVVSLGERSFSARRFGVRFIGNVDDRMLPPNELFSPSGFGERFQFRELTRPDDGYEASIALLGAYTSVDLFLTNTLRLITGVRLERADQRINAESPFGNSREEQPEGRKVYLDPLPAISIVNQLTDTQSLRVAYGATVARPLVREFAPFLSQDFVRGRGVQGNPDLRRTYVHNYDLRWENFLSSTELLAVSVFYKSFLHPIERVIIDTNGNIRYANVEGATNYGLEFELRYGLGRLWRSLETIELGANFAWIASNVQLSQEQKSVATSAERPLAGQSPYVANCSLAYKPSDTNLSLNLFYNVFGPRIREVGLGGLPDTLEEPFHAVDFAASWQFDTHWNLSWDVQNILSQSPRTTQGGLLAERTQRGVTTGLKLGFEY